MHEVLVNRLGGLSLPRKSVVRLTDGPDMTLDIYRGRKTATQQQQLGANSFFESRHLFERVLSLNEANGKSQFPYVKMTVKNMEVYPFTSRYLL